MVQSSIVGFTTLFIVKLGVQTMIYKKKCLLGQWMHCVVIPRQSSHTKLIPDFEIVQK
jgi:hypothetical protein